MVTLTNAERLARLEDIYARGVLSIDFGDGKGSITYANPADLRIAIADLRLIVAAESGTVTATRVIMPWLTSGFGG